jgi:hypothetical protein
MEFAPEDNKIKLLRALAIAGMKDVPKAMQRGPGAAEGHEGPQRGAGDPREHDRARQAGEGDVEGARAALAGPRRPARSSRRCTSPWPSCWSCRRSPNLPKKAGKELKKTGLVKYPNDEVNRYGEALSELAWAREQAKGLGRGLPVPRAGDRRADGRSRAPDQGVLPVRGRVQPGLDDHHQAARVGRVGAGARTGDLAETVFVPAGGSSEVVVPQPGLVTLRVGSRTMTLVTEPYTKLTVQL